MPHPEASSYTIRFHPAEGAAWRLRTRLENDFAGQRMVIETDAVQRVLSVEPSGLYRVETICESMRMVDPITRDAPCAPPEVALLDGAARPHESGNTESVAGSTSNGRPIFLAYPPHPVSVGDTWHDVARWRDPGSTQVIAVDATYALVSVTPRGDDLDAIVRMRGPLTMTDEAADPAARGSAEGEVSGEFVLQIATGFMRETTFDMDFVVTAPASEGGGSARARVRVVARSEPLP